MLFLYQKTKVFMSNQFKKHTQNKVLFLAQAAMISAIYIVITVTFAFVSFGHIQVRFSEMLTILPFFTLAAVPGLFIGALLANLLAGAVLIDVIFGSLATLIAACLTFSLRKKSKYLAPIPPILVNALIIPFVLRYGYGLPVPIPFMALTVGAGQLIACGILGLSLLKILEKYRANIFPHTTDTTNL
jgi:uncharacterized membrane protein